MLLQNQLTTKNGKPIINRLTKLPIYTQPVEQRINNTYKELTGLTKPQATKALTNGKLNESWKNEIKEVLFKVIPVRRWQEQDGCRRCM